MEKSNYQKQAEAAGTLFLTYDQEKIIRKFGLCADDDVIFLQYLHTDYRIVRKSGQVLKMDEEGTWQICCDYETVMTIYDLLCHHQGEAAPVMCGRRKPIAGFTVSGGPDTGRFTNAYAAAFQRAPARLKAACAALGGVMQQPMAGAEVTCLFPVTSFFSVLLQFWAGDEEFPPKITLLWDENTLEFMHFETTYFLQGDLLRRLKELL